MTDANLAPYGEVTKDGGYKLEVSKRSSVVFRNVPLSSFYSAEVEVHIGTSAQTKITARPAPCCGLCSCFKVPHTSQLSDLTHLPSLLLALYVFLHSIYLPLFLFFTFSLMDISWKVWLALGRGKPSQLCQNRTTLSNNLLLPTVISGIFVEFNRV